MYQTLRCSAFCSCFSYFRIAFWFFFAILSPVFFSFLAALSACFWLFGPMKIWARRGSESVAVKSSRRKTVTIRFIVSSRTLTILHWRPGSMSEPGIFRQLRLQDTGEQGQYEKAVELSKQAPRSPDGMIYLYENIANYQLALQHFDEAKQILREAQSRKLDDAGARELHYALAFLASDSEGMEEQEKWFASSPGDAEEGLALASDTEAYRGHPGKALELTKRAADSAVRADNKESGAGDLADAALREAAYGYSADARRLAAEALKLAPESPGAAIESVLAFAMVGDTTRAESLAKDLNKRFPLDTQMQSLWLPAIHAQLALARKDPVSALNMLQPSPIEFGTMIFGNTCLYRQYVRGEAYLADGQGSAATVEFGKILEHSGLVLNCWTGVLAHLGVARANALQSRTSKGADADAARVRALAAYKDFLTLWKDADSDIPILKRAKEEYGRLQ